MKKIGVKGRIALLYRSGSISTLVAFTRVALDLRVNFFDCRREKISREQRTLSHPQRSKTQKNVSWIESNRIHMATAFSITEVESDKTRTYESRHLLTLSLSTVKDSGSAN